MDIDNLNNSQLVLLVFLVTIITSAAIAIGVLAVIYQRLPLEVASESTVIRQTVNRIIEREAETGLPSIIQPQEEIASTAGLRRIQQSFVQISLNGFSITTGVVINEQGWIFVPDVLGAIDEEEGEEVIYTAVYTSLVNDRVYAGRERINFPNFIIERVVGSYTILKPETPYTPHAYIPLLDPFSTLTLGQPVLVYGGFEHQAQIHSEIISQIDTQVEEAVRINVDVETIPIPSAVFSRDTLIGFLDGRSAKWVSVIRLGDLESKRVLRNAEESVQEQSTEQESQEEYLDERVNKEAVENIVEEEAVESIEEEGTENTSEPEILSIGGES